jgi:hypothetical protein
MQGHNDARPREVAFELELVETEVFAVLAVVPKLPPEPAACIVFSAHGDTCFGESSCLHVPGSDGGLLFGHVDNAGGVFSMMKAYFSGKLPPKHVQCQVTYGEEKAINGVYFAGARDVMTSLQPDRKFDRTRKSLL